MTRWMRYTCQNGHIWNQDEAAPTTQVTCFYPKFERTDDHAIEHGITVGGAFKVLCPECGQDGLDTKRHFTGNIGERQCSYACLEAEGGNCKCICGGIYHGTEAK